MIFLIKFFLLSLFIGTPKINGQTTSEKNKLFESIVVKLLDNSKLSQLTSFDSISSSSSCKSTCPCNPVKIEIINLMSKRLKAVWVDYNGIETEPSFTTGNITGDILTIDSFSNHCFRLYINYDNSKSKSIYFKMPSSNSVFYLGDLALIKQLVYNSSWLSNPNLNLQHLQKFKPLIDFQKGSLNKFDFNLLRSTYYDESSETNRVIQSFYESFNKSNKFIDPFFNPVNKINTNEYKAKRISETFVKLPKKYFNASVYLGSDFYFQIINDINMELKIFWVDYSSSLNSWGKLLKGEKYSQNSYLGNVFALTSSQKSYIIDLGKSPFKTNGSTVSVSKITNVINFNIENEKDTTTESIILDKNDLEQYNSRQGNIGNCWFLQNIVSIYARYPKEIVSKFIKPELMTKTGIVSVKLWSRLNNAWRLIVMDDYLAQDNSSNWYTSSPSGVLRNRFWVSLLEKAFAKQLSSFPYLEAGLSSIGISDAYKMILGPFMKGEAIFGVPETDTEAFDKLISYYKNGSVISFSSRKSKNGKLIDDVTCMVDYHGYGLLEARENVDNSGLSFIKAQNTWSSGGEWCGDWSDSSTLWNKYPNIKKSLNMVSKDDGAFWIEKKDFPKAFSMVWMALV